MGDLTGATAELDAYLKQKPDDADAHVALGMVYFTQRHYRDALPHFQKAVQLKPDAADIRTDLGALLASQGDLRGAIQAFEESLKLNPNDARARKYLLWAQTELRNKR